MRRYSSTIVGLPYPNKDGVPCHQVAAELLSEGDQVDLERDRANRHDANAVAVWASGRHVGFIPEAHGFLGEQLDSGRAITATVSGIQRDVTKKVTAVFLAIDLPSSARATADFTRR